MKQGSLTISSLVVGQMAVNCHIVVDAETHDALIVDPGDDADYITEHILRLQVTPKAILATHGHFDHVMAACALQHTYKIPFLIHESDVFLVDRMQESAQFFLGVSAIDPPPHIDRTISGGAPFAVGNTLLTVFHTPGHTPGSISLYSKENSFVINGDLIFAGGAIGRTDFQYSNKSDLLSSVRKILSLPRLTVLYPGHGDSTTVGKQKTYLPEIETLMGLR